MGGKLGLSHCGRNMVRGKDGIKNRLRALRVVVGRKREQVTGEIDSVLVLVFLISYIWLFIDILNLRRLCGFF
jgi:hypothetical protein